MLLEGRAIHDDSVEPYLSDISAVKKPVSRPASDLTTKTGIVAWLIYLCMQHPTLYHLSMGTAGLSLGLVGARTILIEGTTLGAGLMVLGGGGIFLSSLFALSGQSSSEFEPGNFVWIAVVAAIFSVLGMILIFFQ